MKSFLTLATAAVLVLGPALAPAAAAARANNDLIWDAVNSAAGVTLVAKYKESPENGLIDQTLEVQVENAPANTLLHIRVENSELGTMTTDAFGRATARFDRFGVRPDAQGRPHGPRIETGDVIRVYAGSQGINASFVPRP